VDLRNSLARFGIMMHLMMRLWLRCLWLVLVFANASFSQDCAAAPLLAAGQTVSVFVNGAEM
jgi:hypothetical protein